LVLSLTTSASADSWLRSKPPATDKSLASAGPADSGPRPVERNRDLRMAPYSVRMRISTFLAKQHAREGNDDLARRELHSMLALDDPGWPDDVTGDSLRIARDIDVARLMAELGYCDHAMRVLETALVLAQALDDPQAAVLEKQIQSTAKLAQQRGVYLPAPLPIEPDSVAPPVVQVTRSTQAPESRPAPGTVQPANALSRATRAVAAMGSTETRDRGTQPIAAAGVRRAVSETSEQAAPATPQANSIEVVASAESTTTVTSRLQWIRRLVPSFSSSEEIVTHTHLPPPAVLRPTVAPESAADYCPQCARQHGPVRPSLANPAPLQDPWSKSVVLRPQPVPPDPAPAAAPTAEVAAVRPKKERPKAPERSKTGGLISRLKREWTEPHDPAAVANDSVPRPDNRPTPSKTAHAAGHKPEIMLADHTAGALAQPHVGVAGHVAKPGIYAIDGGSTTLAALLRRGAGTRPGADSTARVIRAAGSQSGSAHSGPAVEQISLRTADQSKAYVQDLVLVPSPGESVIHVAVMPHFIVEMRLSEGRAVPWRDVLKSLESTCPAARSEHVAVVLFHADGQATRLSATGWADLAKPMRPGDVLYLDGLGLQHEAAKAAAEAIATALSQPN
jgi:hypothetical protein